MKKSGKQLGVSEEIDELEENLDQKLLEIERLKEELKSTKESLKIQTYRIDFDLLSSPTNKIILDTEVKVLMMPIYVPSK